MRINWIILVFALCVTLVSTLPVTKMKQDGKSESSTQATENVQTALEYERYLKEVVEALESDPEFRKKLDKAPEADIRSGKIAQELDYVNHHVRTKLDEIKRREIQRLRNLAKKEFELSNDINREHMKISQNLHHLDHGNEHTFEIEDLQKLIKKTSEDLAEADRKRRDQFKEYEMQKEFERESKLKEMDEEHRKKYEQELKEQHEKHEKHNKVHHPGNKAQLEEVWEKQDHMDKQDFDPHTFFMLHDVDGNGFWDEVEVKALFVKELDKVYQSGLPEDDMRERAEEMERMREHVVQETDTNRDGLISFQEFLEKTKRDEFNKDPEWETVDEQPQYTHEEYLEFERRRQEEVKRMIAQGLLPPHPNMPQGYYPAAAHDAYQAGQQQHLSGYQQPPQMHDSNPQQHAVHQQQQQQRQQAVYQQQQQQHPQAVYQQQQQQQYQQPMHQQQQQQQYQQPIYQQQQHQQPMYQQQQQQQHQQPMYQQQQQKQEQQHQQPIYQQQQQHQQPIYQQQQQPPQQQQPVHLQQQPQGQQVHLSPDQIYEHVTAQPKAKAPIQQPKATQQGEHQQNQQQPIGNAASAQISNQQPPAYQPEQIPIQQQQQQQNQQQQQAQNIPLNH